jgi:Ca2+-binding RTX toxin-like protein
MISVENTGTLASVGEYFSASNLGSEKAVASWEGSPNLAGGIDLVYQRLSATGEPRSQVVSVVGDSHTLVSDVVELSNGSVVVAWSGRQAGYNNVSFSIFNQLDQLAFSGIGSTRPLDDYINVRVSDLGNGKFLLYSQLHDNFPQTGSFGLAIRLFNYDGTPNTSEVLVLSGSQQNFRNPPLLTSDGNLAIIHTSSIGNELTITYIDSASLGIISSTKLHTYSSVPVVNAEFQNTSLGIIATFTDGTSSYVALVSPSGQLVKTIVVETGFVDGFQAAVSADGHLLVAYSKSGQTFAQSMDFATGALIASETLIGTGTILSESHIALNGNGDFLIALSAANPLNGNLSSVSFISVGSADLAPSVSNFSPSDGSTGVAVDSNIVLTFSEVIARGAGTIELRSGSATGDLVDSFNVATSAQITLSDVQLIINPTNNLSNGTQYFVVIAPGSIIDSTGNNYLGTNAYDFTTALVSPTSENDYIFGTWTDDAINGLGGSDTLEGSSGNDVLWGEAGQDVLYGADGNDTLDGGAGNDSLYGGVGNDSLIGGAGDDTFFASYIYQDGGNAYGVDTIVGGSGRDVLRVFGGSEQVVPLGSLNVSEVEVLVTSGKTISGTTDQFESFDEIVYADVPDYQTQRVDLALVGAGSVDLTDELGPRGVVITTSNFGNSVVSGAAVDILYGADGNDTLDGGAGNDSLYGGVGNDSLIGGAGDDTMSGGVGDDTYLVDSIGDVVAESSAEGTDTVYSSHTYTLAANVENLTLTGTAAINGTGNAFANVLGGNAAANNLLGGEGADKLFGDLGNDTLDGGSGVDSLLGGGGDDSYFVDNSLDVVVEAQEAGIDTVNAAASYILSENLEKLVLLEVPQETRIVVTSYLNGQPYIQSTSVGTGSSNAENNFDLVIGGQLGWTPRRWLGGIDEIRLWSTVRSAEQIGAAYSSAIGGGEAGLAAYFSFDNLDGGVSTDSVSGLNATAYGGVTSIAGAPISGGGSAVHLDGSGYLVVPDAGDSPLDLTENFTIEAWIYSDAWGDEFATVLAKSFSHPSDNVAYSVVRWGSQDKLTLSTFGAWNSYEAGFAAAIEPAILGQDVINGGWQHVAFTYQTLKANDLSGTGNALANTMIGNSGANSLRGEAGNDTVSGNAGEDVMYGGTGNDWLDGGDGVDTASFSGNRSDYRIRFDETSGTFTVSDRRIAQDGRDALTSVEYLNFADGTVAVSAITPDIGPVDGVATGELIVSGAPAEGGTLSASVNNFVDPDGYAVVSYRWQELVGADWVDLGGAAAQASLSIPEDQSFVGKAVRVIATSTDHYGGVTEFVGSTTLIQNVNDAPVVIAPIDLGAIAEDTSRTITAAELLAGATDVDGDNLTVSNLAASSGSLVDNNNGTWTWTPAPNDTIGVTLTYNVTDGTAAVAQTASLDLTPVNDTPVVAAPVSLGTTPEDTAKTITASALLAGATDADGDVLSVANLQASSGSLVNNNNDTWTWTPAANDTTGVTFTYNVTDGTALAAQTATLDLTSVNDAPTGAVVIQGSALQGQTLTANTTAIADADGVGSFSFIWYRNGSAILGATAATYLLTAGDVGAAITVRASYSDGFSTAESLLSAPTALVTSRSTPGVTRTGTTRADTLNGTGGDDVLSGLAGNDVLTGLGGNDRLLGGDGNDTLSGGLGGDTLDGGAGTDTATYADATTGVTVSLAITIAQETGVGADQLINVENLIGGNGNDTLSGNASANNINGGGGDDRIMGGAGNDTLAGGANGAAGDTVSYADATARVTVSLATTSAQNTGTSTGSDVLSGFENLEGSAFADQLTGSIGNNVIRGGAGADRITGGDGTDFLYGGAGADTFVFAANSNSRVGIARDVIFDWELGDVLDFSAIDANTVTRGNQAFTFIGASAFTAAGQLRMYEANGVLLVEGNTGGTIDPEFQLELRQWNAATFSDILL